MATYEATAIVIGRTNFGEADRIVRLLTREHGKLSGIAKGVRRIKSRLGGHLELLGHVKMMLAEGKSLEVVTSARLIWYPHNLAANYHRLGQAFMFASMMDRLLEDHQHHPELFDLLLTTLTKLDEGADAALLELWFKLQLLRGLGYQPELSRCSVCGGHDGAANYAFSAERGGIVDEGCRGAGETSISHDAIKLWRLLGERTYDSISHVIGAETLATSSLALCDEFYEYHLGRSFRPQWKENLTHEVI